MHVHLNFVYLTFVLFMYLSPFFTLHVPKGPFPKAEYINNTNKNVTLLINILNLITTDIIHGVLLNIADL